MSRQKRLLMILSQLKNGWGYVVGGDRRHYSEVAPYLTKLRKMLSLTDYYIQKYGSLRSGDLRYRALYKSQANKNQNN